MRKSTIRLTESELVTLVNRIVNENMMSNAEMEEGWLGDKMKSKFGWVMDAAKKVAELFKNDYMDNIPEEELEELKKKSENFVPTKDGVEGMDSEEGEEALNEAAYMLPSSKRLLREGLLLEGKMLDKAMRILNKLGIFAGIGITGAGFLSFASQAMGYTDSTFLTTVHQIVQGFGCGIYCGPLSLLVILIGIALAIRSTMMSHKRKPGALERGRLGESRRRYERKNPRRYRRR